MRFFNDKNLKIIYKILTVLLAVYWIFFVAVISFRTVERIFFYPLKYQDEISHYSELYDLNKTLVFSVVNVESGFDKNAESKKGAVGLMQLTEKTANYVGLLLNKNEYDLKNAKDNLEMGCFYLKYLLNKFENVNTALSAYNAGEGKVLLWLKDDTLSKDGIALNKIPYKETEEYVKKINKTFTKYRKLYGKLLDK